jgi:hypothetical protein
MRKSLEKANEEISGLKKSVKASIQHLSKARQEGYEQRGRELQAELEAAAAIGDVAASATATESIVALEKEVSAAPAEAGRAGGLPRVRRLAGRQPVVRQGQAADRRHREIAAEVLAEGYTGKAQIKEVDRRVSEAFPEKFAKPRPTRTAPSPSIVEGLGSARRPTGKAFSDMPKEHQEMWADMNKLPPPSPRKTTRRNTSQESNADDRRNARS